MGNNESARVDRREFMKAAAISAAAISAHGGTPEPLKYPRAHDVGEHCECVLWLNHYDHFEEKSSNPWTIEEIYTRPLLSFGFTNGLFDKLLEPRVAHAAATKNSKNNNMISVANRQRIEGAVGAFKSSGSNNKRQSIASLMLADISYDPAGNHNTTDTALVGLLKAFYDTGLYLPSNHVGRTQAHKDAIRDLLGNGALWEYMVPNGVTGVDTRLGSMTFHDMFHTELRVLKSRFDNTFQALKKAKGAGIFRPERKLPSSPDGIHAEYTPNGKCCDPVTGVCQPFAGKYCAPTNPPTNMLCNSMSDSC